MAPLSALSITSRPEFFVTFTMIIAIFGAIYAALDWNSPLDKNNRTKYFQYGTMENNTPFQKVWNKMYMSITTLTTLGYGDIYPVHPLSQLVVAIQSFLAFALITELVKKN